MCEHNTFTVPILHSAAFRLYLFIVDCSSEKYFTDQLRLRGGDTYVSLYRCIAVSLYIALSLHRAVSLYRDMRLCLHVSANIQLYRSAIRLMYRSVSFGFRLMYTYVVSSRDVSHQCIGYTDVYICTHVVTQSNIDTSH